MGADRRVVQGADGGDQRAVGPNHWDDLSAQFVRTTAAQRLKALGHPDRLRIVEILARRPAYVGEIAAYLSLPLGTVSRHLRILKAVGLVASSQTGNRVLYALTDREIPRLAAFAYRGAAAQARRIIALAPDPPEAEADALSAEMSDS